MNETLYVNTTSTRYPVIVAAGALAHLPAYLAEAERSGACWLVYDRAVAAQAEGIKGLLRAAGYRVEGFAVPSGEASKNAEQLGAIQSWLLEGGVERRDTLLAFGGGVIGDLAGFAAATVLRGIAVVQLPTTLLAMVDAAVGGKTGINHPHGKNLIGAFHQPKLVLADPSVLATLPSRELAAGWAEVIKHGVIRDAGLFVELEMLAALQGWHTGMGQWPAEPPELVEQLSVLIRRAVAVKVEVVSRDEFEQGERMHLNYGHTIGHAIEALAGYGTLLHGEAVAIGMQVAARLALGLGLIGEELVARQGDLLRAFGLPTSIPAALPNDDLIARTLRDKKVAQGKVRWVLPTGLGSVVVRNDISEAAVRAALNATR